MTHEETAVPKGVKKFNKDLLPLKSLSTVDILWHLVQRHKFGLVAFYAVIITMLFLFPFLIPV